ncbi:hypothetical protein NL676_013115 [Syzygium grande]|nr:hypothetical protein NL676_013115 [Syzygium grande]
MCSALRLASCHARRRRPGPADARRRRRPGASGGGVRPLPTGNVREQAASGERGPSAHADAASKERRPCLRPPRLRPSLRRPAPPTGVDAHLADTNAAFDERGPSLPMSNVHCLPQARKRVSHCQSLVNGRRMTLLQPREPSRILTRLCGEDLPRKMRFVRLKQPQNVHLK